MNRLFAIGREFGVDLKLTGHSDPIVVRDTAYHNASRLNYRDPCKKIETFRDTKVLLFLTITQDQ